MSNMQLLQPLSLALTQNALIEASAGTGKTYTITTLYLRALLGLLDDKLELRPLTIEQILVVTFTEAATQEIKNRVRTKLQETQKAILLGKSKDNTLNQLLNEFVQRFCQINPDSNHEKANLYAYHRLQDAITLIDEASIFTIHGFSHRCLKQFAFETNASFEQTFEMDAKPILLNALQDFWRKHVIELQEAEFAWFEHTWTDPDKLYNSLKEVIGKSIHIKPEISTEEYTELLNQYQTLVSQLKTQWLSDNFGKTLMESGLLKTKVIYKRIPVLNEWMASSDWLPPFVDKDTWLLWGTESLSVSTNYSKNKECVVHPITSLIDKLADIEFQLKQGRFASFWITKAKSFIEQRSRQLKNEQGIINPDDLLVELLTAIDVEEGNGLVQAIQNKYPLTFVDEFQDTDPVQYGIFNAVYGNKAIPNANMILIGDPKQAIYKFRGADIFTYIQAKTDIPSEQHYTLGVNWRSQPNLITAVNQIFTQSENVFRHVQIPFINVSAGLADSEHFIDNGVNSPNLEFWHLTPESMEEDNREDIQDPSAAPSTQNTQVGLSKNHAEPVMAKWCATDIKRLLLDAQQGKTLFVSSGEKQALLAKDICILVRNRHQARLIKTALSDLDISSVFISRDNVFKTELAKDLLRLLFAIETPANEQKVRGACAGALFDYSTEQLMQIHSSSALWQAHLEWFYTAHELWQRGKIASAIQFIIDHAQSFIKWQENPQVNADRLITDFRHLMELIQQESVVKPGPQKLLLWFEQLVTASDDWSDASDEQQLRLESDSNLVQITTLHASKGLEYPIVYLPFVSEYKAASTAIYNSGSEISGLSYRVDNRKQELAQAEEERLAEDLRLLYVAMTRPVYKLVIGLYNVIESKSKKSVLQHTGIGQLLLAEHLTPETFITDELLNNVCLQLTYQINQDNNITNNSHINADQVARYITLDQQQLIANFDISKQQEFEQTKTLSNLFFSDFDGTINKNWKMLSYSSLAAQHQQDEVNDEDIWLAGLSDEDHSINYDNYQLDQTHLNELETPFTFPKGANAGTCLHWMLENLDFTQPVSLQNDVIITALERYGFEETWLNGVSLWMQEVLDRDLNDFCLKQIQVHQKLVEMEFYFSFETLTPEILNNALLMSGIEGHHVNKSILNDHTSLTGILKGFIDLTVCVDGRYSVLDYKSNYLGNSLQDYSLQNMEVAMTDHSYQLQALIYILALHRFLKLKIANYDYDRHIGGSYYLFLRGLSKTNDKTGCYQLSFRRDVIEYLDNALLKKQVNSPFIKPIETEPAKLKVREEPQKHVQTKLENEVVNNEQIGFDFDE